MRVSYVILNSFERTGFMISVVIPLYKVESYIKSCLISLENQSFKDFEVIVVNDGSPDRSADIVEDFIKSSKLNVRLINQENRGVSAARNKGIDYISGEYLCFMDSDDMLDSEYLMIMQKEINMRGGDICICRSRHIDENESRVYTFKDEYKSEELSKNQILEKLLYGEVSAGIWAVLCRRDVLGELRFAENFRYSEDLEMVWKLAAVSNKIVSVNAPLYGYRIRKGSAMAVMDERRLDGLKLFENLSDFIKEKAPEFYPQYEKFGVARWVWSTVWQEAMASESYKEFCERIRKYTPEKYIKKLFKYKNSRVKISSILFIYFKRGYYAAVKKYRKKYRKIN